MTDILLFCVFAAWDLLILFYLIIVVFILPNPPGSVTRSWRRIFILRIVIQIGAPPFWGLIIRFSHLDLSAYAIHLLVFTGGLTARALYMVLLLVTAFYRANFHLVSHRTRNIQVRKAVSTTIQNVGFNLLWRLRV